MHVKSVSRLSAIILIPVFMTLFGFAAQVMAQQSGSSEETVKSALMSRLEKHKLLPHNKIEVSVSNQTITLRGTARTLWEKMQAESFARQEGIEFAVVNDMAVEPFNVSDRLVADSVYNRINKYLFYSIFDWVTVRVEKGVVTLTGWAHERWLVNEFEKQAAKVKGVTKIDNQIRELPVSIRDDEIRHEAASIVYNDPSFEPFAYFADRPVHIIVNDGKVTLLGYVATEAEKNWAGNLINTVTDAMSVSNEIQVK